MKMHRRKFLRGIAAAPVAAKGAAESLAAKAAGLGVIGKDAVHTNMSCEPEVSGSNEAQKQLRDWILQNGLPEWRKKELFRSSKYVTALDPDIASMRSFSLAGKVAMQANRNFEKSVDRFHESTEHEDIVEKFTKATGLERWRF